MRNKNRAFSGFVLAGACLLAGPAHAVTVVPNVTTANPSASSSGQVPDPDPNNFLGVIPLAVASDWSQDGPIIPDFRAMAVSRSPAK